MATLITQFRVRGEPAPEGSKFAYQPKDKAGTPYGRPRVLNANPTKLSEWRKDVKTAAAGAFQGQPLAGVPVFVRAVFYFTRAASHTAKQREMPWVTKAPDCEKLVRAVNDALLRLLYDNDAQVAWIDAAKLYAYGDHLPGVEVEIWELEPRDTELLQAAVR